MRFGTTKEGGAPGREWASLLALVLAPIAAKFHLLIGFLKADPMLLYGGMQSGLAAGVLNRIPPYPTIDPNIAFTSHAFGHRAALDLFSGRMPWWNHFEGVGAPLVGEMQSAALFPLTWLLLLPDGQLYMHIALQVIAGLATWALLRKLGCTVAAAVAGALVFEFNGTFSWLANAVVNPIPFLPLVLLGVETVREKISQGQKGGAAWITVGLAASLYAGFPEVAYLNGLLIGLWTLVRTAVLAPALRRPFLVRVGLGAVAALAISAPVLVPFFNYLPLANLGGHDGSTFASLHLSPTFLVALLAPYAFGGIFENATLGAFWGSVGGYGGCLLFGLALCGAVGRSHRHLRLLLAGWVAVTIALSYGLLGLDLLVKVVPGLGSAAFFRYLPPSWEFSLSILAALALSDLAQGAPRRHLAVFAGVTGVALALTLAVAFFSTTRPGGDLARLNLAFIGLLALASVLLAWRFRQHDFVARGLAVLLVVEAVAYFVLPTLSLPSAGKVELGGVTYLKTHIGLQRFATTGPVQPNYGSYFGLASINHNDLPIPRAWTDYVARHLDKDASPVLFTGATAVDDLTANPDAYRRVGVRYVLTSPEALDAPGFEALKAATANPATRALTPVYADAGMRIFELSDPAPYFSAPGCLLVPRSRDEVQANCAAPSSLMRLELYMPGWRAKVGDVAASVSPADEIFQRVELPAGASTVRFRFTPPNIEWAYLAFVLGWALFALNMIWRRPGDAPQSTDD